MRGLILLAALGLLIVGFLFLLRGSGERSTRIEAGPSSAVEPRAPAEITAADSTRPRLRARTPEETVDPVPEVLAMSTSAPAAAESEQELVEVHGLVVDPGALALAGVRVRLKDTEHATDTDGSGRFALEVPLSTSHGQLIVDDPDYASVRPSNLQPDDFDVEHVVIALPAIRLAGVVRDGAGGVVAGAGLQIDVASDFERDFPYPLDRNAQGRPAALSGIDGTFSFRRVPASRGAFAVRLSVRADGYETETLDVPASSNEGLVVILTRAEDQARLRGTVQLPDGSPAVDATVMLGGKGPAFTGVDGSFSLAVDGWIENQAPLVAGLEGYGSAIFREAGRSVLEARPGSPPPVTLVLSDISLFIAGRILDSDDQPAGWYVDLVDPEVIVPGRFPPITAENFLTPLDRVQADEDGTFRLTSLQERSYTIRARDPATFATVVVEDVAAGKENVLIRIPPDLTLPEVRGVVVDGNGSPVQNAQVAVGFYMFRNASGSSYDTRDPALTDAQGNFELLDVPRERVFVSVSGEAVVPRQIDLTGDENLDPLVIQVKRRCRFRLRTGTSDFAGLTFAVNDEEGAALPLYRFRGGGWSSAPRWNLEGSRTEIFAVGEHGRTLVVFRDDVEIHSESIRLFSDSVLEVEFELD